MPDLGAVAGGTSEQDADAVTVQWVGSGQNLLPSADVVPQAPAVLASVEAMIPGRAVQRLSAGRGVGRRAEQVAPPRGLHYGAGLAPPAPLPPLPAPERSACINQRRRRLPRGPP